MQEKRLKSKQRARSSMDRAIDYESIGWGFESLRARLIDIEISNCYYKKYSEYEK